MLGDKIKEVIYKLNTGLGVTHDSGLALQELDQLIEKANRVGELVKQHETDLKLIELATKFIDDDLDNDKYIELGKAIEWALKNNYAVVTFDDYQEVDKYIGTTEELKNINN